MKLIDLKDESPSTKRDVRIKMNDALSWELEKEGTDFFRQRVRDYLDDDTIPPYEVGVVVGDNHANYHERGFQGGQSGKDDPKSADMTLEETVSFLT